MKKWILAVVTALSVLSLRAGQTVKAADFGFDPADATECLQKAIDSGASRVLVEKQSSPWLIGKTIHLRSNQTIVFTDGCEVLAKPGEFQDSGACLFLGDGCKNIALQGVGNARLAMRRSDYDNRAIYKWSEWRHALSFYGCENVRITDLAIEESGGDGIYLGSRRPGKPCRGFILENLKCNRNYRQGISIIHAVDVVIRNSQFNDTKGTPPAAGIDLEPNRAWQELKNIRVEHCEFNGNQGGGILLQCAYIRASNVRDVVIRDCHFDHNTGYGLRLDEPRGKCIDRTDQGPGLLVRGCSFCGNGTEGLSLVRCVKGNFPVEIRDCTFDCTKSSRCALLINNSELPGDFEGVKLENVAFKPGKGGEVRMFHRIGYGVLPGAVSMNFTMERNGKAVPYDWAAFAKKHAPDAQLQKVQTADFLPDHLLPVSKNPISATAKNAPELRGNGLFVQYLGKDGGELKLRFLRRRLGRKNKRTQITVKDAIGTILDAKEIPTNDYTYTFRTDKSVCVVEVDSCDACLKILSTQPGCGWVTQNALPLASEKSKSYFVVPKGTKSFVIYVSGSIREPVTAELRDSKGTVRAKCEKLEGIAALKVEQKASAKMEIWELNVPFAKEDHAIQMGEPLIPVLSASPEAVLVQGQN